MSKKYIILLLSGVALVTGFILAYILISDTKAKADIKKNSAALMKTLDDADSNNDTLTDDEKKRIKKEAKYDTQIENLNNDTIKKATKHAKTLKKDVIGRIEAPSINLSLPLFEGVSEYKLAVGAGTLKKNQDLDKIGNFAIGGHNMHTRQNILFSHLPEIKKGSPVYVTYAGKKATYRIHSINVIEPTDVIRIQDDEAIDDNVRMLTLITCTPDSKNRYLVRGEQVNISK